MVNDLPKPPNQDGRSFRIPACRRLTWDLLWFHKSVPLCGHDRHVQLSSVADARTATAVRISWPAIFLKAYALVAAEVPELRQTWYRWPWAHLYQHPNSVATLTVQREENGQRWLFWGKIPAPETLSLRDIQHRIDAFTSEPVRRQFRREYQLAQLPTLLRRLIWGWNIHVAKHKRARRLGTFFLSTLSGRGVEIQIPPSIHTGCLTYGPVTATGLSRVTLAYDHRIMDGALVAECLERLECVLFETVRDELLQLANPVANIITAA